MNRKIFFLSFTIALMTTLLCSAEAFSARGCADGDLAIDVIAVDKTAPGTKYKATLVLNYEDTQSTATTCQGLSDMQIFLRMESNVVNWDEWEGTDYFAFDGTAECIQYFNEGPDPTWRAYEIQQEKVIEFFKYTVNPYIYLFNNWPNWCDPDGLNPELAECPPFALKSVDKIVEDGAGQSSGLRFMIMDLVIAIDE